MNKIIILLLVCTYGCQSKEVQRIAKDEFKNRTFTLEGINPQDSLVIEFKDSIYYGFSDIDRHFSYKITSYQNSDFLILEGAVIGITKISETEYDCTRIGDVEGKFKFIERKPKWNKEKLYGTWIEEIYIGTDSTDFPPPPIFYDVKSNWPPSITITEENITQDFYLKSKSDIEINNSVEYILMDLSNPVFSANNDILWDIKFLSDSLLIVGKERLEYHQTSMRRNRYSEIKYIRKQ